MIFKLLIVGVTLMTMEVPPQEEFQITFIGNEAFEITDGKTTLLTDFPYESGAFGYMTYNDDMLSARKNATCLITHQHKDHFDAALVRKIGCKVLGPPDVLKSIPFDARWKWNRNHARIQDIDIKAIPTSHGNADHFSYLVSWKNRKLYFVGDTDDPAELLKQAPLDFLFITPWLAKKIPQTQLKSLAQRIVIYHHRSDETIDCSFCLIPQQNTDILSAPD